MTLDALKQLAERHPALRTLLRPALEVRRRLTGYYERERFMDHLETLLAEDPVLRVPSFEGTFAMDPRSHVFKSILPVGDYEPALARFCLQHLDPERDALDVGANVGLYTVLMARHLRPGRRVLAVEPTANALRRLHANLARNGVGGERAEVFEGVVSDREGTLTLHTIEGREEYSTIGEMSHPYTEGVAYASVEVPATTLDALVAARGLDPGFMKVDVEGAEAAVFGGATAVLSGPRPVVLSELSDHMLRQNGSSAAAIVQLFERHDYRVIDPMRPDRPAGQKRFGDILCVPRERLA